MDNMNSLKKNYKIHFYSDPHYGHKNIIKYCDRPFSDVDHMTKEMIRRYNETVRKNDMVIWVGDCFFGYSKNEAIELMNKLNGKKILVKGNHDLTNKQMMAMGFDFCADELVYTIGGERVTVSHYPFSPSLLDKLKKRIIFGNSFVKRYTRYIERRPVNNGQFLIHGHTHSSEVVKDRMIHVGVDCWDYAPVSLGKIEKIIYDIKICEKNKISYKEYKRGVSK